MPGLIPAKQAPKQGPEGILLFVLVIAVIITLASFFLTHHPAGGIELPLSESGTSAQPSAAGGN
jgi:hypothetical protein